MKRYISFVLALLILSTAFTLFICAEAPVLNSFETMKGASVRIGDVGGIRFKTKISKSELASLGSRVSEIGTVIAPAAYVKGEFTMDALADVNKGSAGYVKVVASVEAPYDEDAEYYYFAGSLENIKSKNKMLEYKAVGYMIVDGEPIYAKAPTDSRSVGYVAYHAYIDENSGLGAQDKGKLEVFANAYLADTYGYANVSGDAPSVDEIVFAEDFDGKDGKDALAELGLSEVLRYTSAIAYSYGKSITGSVQGGKGVFTFTNGARDNYTSESGYKNTLGVANRDASHAFMKIGGLDNTAIFADGKDKYSIQYTLKIRDATEGDAGFGISICEKNTNFARGQYIAYADAPELTTFTTNNGASVRIGDVAGIRFKTTISKTEFNAVKDSITEIGTIIAPKAYVANEQAFTMDALATVNNGAEGYVKVIANKSRPFAEDSETVAFAGSLENIKVANYTLEYVARGYVVIGGTTYYAAMSDARTVGYVSYKAYLDTASGLGDSAKSLIVPFANAFLAEVYGGSTATAAPTIDQILFIEDFNDMVNGTDVMAAMGLTDTYRNGSGSNYIYGKDVTATAQDGKAVFVSKNSGRANHTDEDGFKGDEDGNNRTNKDTAHGLFVIPELNKSALFANGNDTYVMQFTFDIDETTVYGDCGIGLAVCEKGTNLGRGIFIAYSGESWILCTEEGASPSEDSSSWYKKPGALTAYQDANGNISQKLTVRFVINIDQSVQQIYIDKGNGMELAHSGVVLSAANQIANDFEIGLYFLKGGTIELDNFAVWSYKSET